MTIIPKRGLFRFVIMVGFILFHAVASTADDKNADRIKPYEKNPRYWQYEGKPVLLLGGSPRRSTDMRSSTLCNG